MNYLATLSDFCQQMIRWSWTQGQDKPTLTITKCVPLSNVWYNLLKAVRKLWIYIPFHWRRCNNFGSSFVFPICCNLTHVLRTWEKKQKQMSPVALMFAHLFSIISYRTAWEIKWHTRYLVHALLVKGVWGSHLLVLWFPFPCFSININLIFLQFTHCVST